MAIGFFVYRVEGISGLLMHNPSAMSIASSTPGIKKIPTPAEEAEKAVYINKDGQLYTPTIMYKSSLLGGAVGKRINKRAASIFIQAGVFEAEEETLIFDPKSGEPITTYSVHTARVVVQKNGIIRARAMIPAWAADVILEIDDDFITPEQVMQIFAWAGRIAGIGDWRPAKRGRFGRYKVLEYRALSAPLKQAA